MRAEGPGPIGHPHVLEPKKLLHPAPKPLLTQWDSFSENHMNSTYWEEHEVVSLFQRWFCMNFVHTVIRAVTKTPSDAS